MVVELYNPNSLRTLGKRVLPAPRVADRTEGDVYVRYDDRRALEAALPRGFVIERARGIRVVTPAAHEWSAAQHAESRQE